MKRTIVVALLIVGSSAAQALPLPTVTNVRLTSSEAAAFCGPLPGKTLTYFGSSYPSYKTLTPAQFDVKYDGFYHPSSSSLFYVGYVLLFTRYTVTVQCKASNPSQQLVVKWTKTVLGPDETLTSYFPDVVVCDDNGIQQNGYGGPCSPNPETWWDTIYV